MQPPVKHFFCLSVYTYIHCLQLLAQLFESRQQHVRPPHCRSVPALSQIASTAKRRTQTVRDTPCEHLQFGVLHATFLVQHARPPLAKVAWIGLDRVFWQDKQRGRLSRTRTALFVALKRCMYHVGLKIRATSLFCNAPEIVRDFIFRLVAQQ